MSQSVTLKDIAKEANLSIGAVSKALSGHADASDSTRQRVLEISERLNYQPRRRASREAASSDKPSRVAFLLCGMQGSSKGDYRASRIELMTGFAAEKGLRLELSSIDSLIEQHKASGDKAISGFDAIALCGDLITYDIVQKVHALGRPWISFGAPTGELSQTIDTGHLIVEPTHEMGLFATQALLKAGHTRIGFAAGARVTGGWNAGWLAGYHIALLNHGLPVDPALAPSLQDGPITELGTRAAEYFHSLDEPATGFVFPTCTGASRFLSSMHSRGTEIRPDQLIFSSDGTEIPYFEDYGIANYPVVFSDLKAECQHATELLRAMVDGGCPTPARHYIPFKSMNFEAFEQN